MNTNTKAKADCNVSGGPDLSSRYRWLFGGLSREKPVTHTLFLRTNNTRIQEGYRGRLVHRFLIAALLMFGFAVHDEAQAQSGPGQWACTSLNGTHLGSGAIESDVACGDEAYAEIESEGGFGPGTGIGPAYSDSCTTPPTALGQECFAQFYATNNGQNFEGYILISMTSVNGQNHNKDTGVCPTCEGQGGEPIVMSVGNKILKEQDFEGGGASPLRLTRFYNSTPVAASHLGFITGWMHNYGMEVIASANYAEVSRPDGKTFAFNLVSGAWTSDADVSDKLVQLTSGSTVTGWQYTNASDDSLETYDPLGNLLSIAYRDGKSVTLSYATGESTTAFPAQLISATDQFGNQLRFNSTANPRTMTDPKGELFSYGLNSTSTELTSVGYPDSTSKSYLYNESAYVASSMPLALTGVMDENNSRYDSTWYDSNGFATRTALAGGVNQYSMTNTLDANNRIQSVSMADPLGAIRGRGFSSSVGRNRLSSVTQPATSGQPAGSKTLSFDANGNVSSSTDLDGNLQCSVFDLTRNLETGRVEGLAPGSTCPANIASYVPASGTVQRKTLTQYHAIWHLPAKRAEP